MMRNDGESSITWCLALGIPALADEALCTKICQLHRDSSNARDTNFVLGVNPGHLWLELPVLCHW